MQPVAAIRTAALERRAGWTERLLPPAFGLLSGTFAQLNRLAEQSHVSLTVGELAEQLALGAAFGAVLFTLARRALSGGHVAP